MPHGKETAKRSKLGMCTNLREDQPLRPVQAQMAQIPVGPSREVPLHPARSSRYVEYQQRRNKLKRGSGAGPETLLDAYPSSSV